MCDFSLQHAKSRPAHVADEIVTQNFGSGTSGFADVASIDTAVCVLPGTELAFDRPIVFYRAGWLCPKPHETEHKTAIFRQIDKDNPHRHHDAIEMPDGETVLLTLLENGQRASVLQLPAAPSTPAEAREQERAAFVG